jgi:L-lactate dehydrogenase complex protein LldE
MAAGMRIGLMATCLVDGMFPDVAGDTVTLLRRLGHQVELPAGQTCCGQLHINTGYPRQALPLVRRYVETFAEFDAVVAPSGSCIGSVRHQHAALARQFGDQALAAAAQELAGRSHELSEFLVDVLGVVDVGACYPHSVTYHPTCHSLRMLRVGDKPLRLLRAVRGIDLVELPEADSCCGFGGTFALKNADVSAAMLTDKLAQVIETGAGTLCASDSSCLMHLGGGLTRMRALDLKRKIKPVHLASILAAQAPA